MYEVLDDTAARVILALESGDSIHRVAQHLHTPYETVRQAINRLEEAGYVRYDDGLSVVDDRVRDAARELVAASASVSPPSIEEAYVIPQFGAWPFAFKWFHTFKMRGDRFHNSWVGSRANVKEWLEQFEHYYNIQRPHQSLKDASGSAKLDSAGRCDSIVDQQRVSAVTTNFPSFKQNSSKQNQSVRTKVFNLLFD